MLKHHTFLTKYVIFRQHELIFPQIFPSFVPHVSVILPQLSFSCRRASTKNVLDVKTRKAIQESIDRLRQRYTKSEDSTNTEESKTKVSNTEHRHSSTKRDSGSSFSPHIFPTDSSNSSSARRASNATPTSTGSAEEQIYQNNSQTRFVPLDWKTIPPEYLRNKSSRSEEHEAEGEQEILKTLRNSPAGRKALIPTNEREVEVERVVQKRSNSLEIDEKRKSQAAGKISAASVDNPLVNQILHGDRNSGQLEVQSVAAATVNLPQPKPSGSEISVPPSCEVAIPQNVRRGLKFLWPISDGSLRSGQRKLLSSLHRDQSESN